MPPRRNKPTMPGLTVDTSPNSQSQHSPHSNLQSKSRSSSPVRPPVSPITPTLGPASLATSSNNVSSTSNQRQTYTHTQPPQTAIPQPPPVPIKFEENPDALALKAAMSILQLQARNAENDMRTLARMKERAMQDPAGFAEALENGKVRTKGDALFNPSFTPAEEEDDDDDEDQEMEDAPQTATEGKEKEWGALPRPQNIIRCPPINWHKYAVVGESLDKLHEDQKRRPSEGMPQVLMADGTLRSGGEGLRRPADLGIAAPYMPGRDRVEKMSTRKGGKR